MKIFFFFFPLYLMAINVTMVINEETKAESSLFSEQKKTEKALEISDCFKETSKSGVTHVKLNVLPGETEVLLTEENLAPFHELMFSWNAQRPTQGQYLFYVRVFTDAWSPWMIYGSWGSEGQLSFSDKAEGFPARVYQDAVETLDGVKATGVQIHVIAEGGAPLDKIYGIHLYTNGDRDAPNSLISLNGSRVEIPVLGISQMQLEHPRYDSLCSPTSTTAVVRYLLQDHTIDPVRFAQNSWDRGFDIFGNWVLNIAEASNLLGEHWDCWVERLEGFHAIVERLHQNTPVIVSVRGPLPGSAQPYAKGHLLVVTGFDPAKNQVLCMDPAFPTDGETHVSYDLDDFVASWNRRGKVAYLFARK